MTTCILDKKTGKAEPWCALQTAAYTLLDTPVDFNQEGHIYTAGGYALESVTTVLKQEGCIDARFYTEEARQRGTLVHLATHLDDMDDLVEDSVDPVIVPYLEAWRKFKRETGFVVEVSERHMMSSVYKYAGTPDTIGRFPSGTLKRAAVELHNDGTYKLVPYTDRQDVNVWLSILAGHNWKKNNLKGAKP